MTVGIVKLFRGFLIIASVAMLTNVITYPMAYTSPTSLAFQLLILFPIVMNLFATTRFRMTVKRYPDVFPNNKSWVVLSLLWMISLGLWVGSMIVAFGPNYSFQSRNYYLSSYSGTLWASFGVNCLCFVASFTIYLLNKNAVNSSTYASMEALEVQSNSDEEMSPRSAPLPAPMFATSAPPPNAPVYILSNPNTNGQPVMMSYNPAATGGAPVYLATNPGNVMTSQPQFMYTTAPNGGAPVIYYTNPQ